MQITENMTSVLNLDHWPIHHIKDYNEINNFLDQAEFLVVITAGNIFLHRDKLYEKISNLDKNIGLLAHLLQFETDETPFIHEQFFIVNTKALDNINLTFENYQSKGNKIQRSKEDVHCGHAPLYVTLEDEICNRKMKFGSSLIEQVLKNDFLVKNFDDDWREFKDTKDHYLKLKNLPLRGFCYPKKNTERFSQALKEIKIYDDLDHSQKVFLDIVKKGLEYNVLNAWHYDFVPDIDKEIQHVIVPATGFLGEQIAYRTGAAKITFYDINKNNIEFKKHLYNSWDGKDYEDFYKNWAEEKNLSIEPSFAEDMKLAEPNIKETESTIFPRWNEWKNNIAIKYIHDDLIGCTQIIDSITEQSLVFTSTILNVYTFTSIIHSKDEINKTKKLIENKVKCTNSIWIEI